jgi:hypothetical protein
MFEVDFKILNQKATPAIYADTLALRPSPGFVGRLFIATDSPYGVFRDTGTAWVQVASNGGGGGSTGVNGLNGTTNIGLGGTLTNTITNIDGNGNRFNILNTLSCSITNVDTGISNSLFCLGDSIFLQSSAGGSAFSIFRVKNNIQLSIYGGATYGLNLDFLNQRFALGDYNITAGKKNSIQIDDSNNQIYFTTGRSTSNLIPDLLFAENTSSSVRVVKLGDFGNFNNKTKLFVDDGNTQIYTETTSGIGGIFVNNNVAILGSQFSGGTNLNIQCDYPLNTIQTYNSFTNVEGLRLDFANRLFSFGAFNLGGNFIDVDDVNNSIKFETSNLIYNGLALEDPTPGVVATKALLITLNGTQYKINLY